MFCTTSIPLTTLQIRDTQCTGKFSLKIFFDEFFIRIGRIWSTMKKTTKKYWIIVTGTGIFFHAKRKIRDQIWTDQKNPRSDHISANPTVKDLKNELLKNISH